MFPAKEFPPKGIFGLGDDKYYHTFHNRPLSPGKLYRVFLRVFAGHFDQNLLHNEGNTSTHFHSKYPKYTSSRLSESFGLPLHTDMASSYNLLTSQYGEGPFLSLPDRNDGRERIKLAKNKKIAQLSWPLKSLSLIIIALSIVISLLILALLCYFFVFHKRRKSTKRSMLANKGMGDEKLNDDMDADGAEKKKLLIKPSKHQDTSVIFSNAYNSVQTDCYQDQSYAPLSPYDEGEENDTVIFNDKVNTGVIFKNGSLLSAMSKKSSQDKQQHSQYNTKSLTRRGKVSAASISSSDAKMKDYKTINLANLPPDPVTSRRFNYRTTAMSTHPPVTLKELPEYITKLKTNDNALFSQEYESIDPGQVFTWEHSSKESNKCRNRYANVVAYDHTRVILSTPDTLSNNDFDDSIANDYINANYIDGYRKPGAYIATQGPLPETVEDFWRMIWEQNTCIIVMLTKLEERARIKCDQYWPSRGTTEFYGKELQNTMLDSVELATYTIRTFSLNKVGTNESREVKQYQFTAWPDHGVPDYPTPFLYFLRRVKAANPPNAGPLVVHCSAGVGRTGTFIVIDSMIERMKIEDTVDVYGHVTLMRAQRNFMVQTEDQYIFIYDSILEAFECGDTEVPAIELSSHLQRLNNIIPGETMTGLEMEFKKLCNQKVSPAKFVSANYSVNKYKNRLVNILPFESNRVCLFPIRGIEGSDYINASFIDGYRTKNAYIATQGPLAETIEDFWRMLWEHNSNIIVMLTKLRENGREKSVQYWPIDCSVRYGRFVIEPVAEYTMPQYTLREFKVTDVKGSMPIKGNTLNYHHNENIELQPYTTSTTINAMGNLDDSCYGSLNYNGTAPALHPVMRCLPITSNIQQQPASTAITTTRTIRQFQFDYPIEEEFSGLESNCNTGLRRVSKQNENVPLPHHNAPNFLSTSSGTVPRPSNRVNLITSSPAMSERKNITLKVQADDESFNHVHDSSFFSIANGINMNPILSHSTTADCLGNNGLEEVFVDFIGQVHKTKEQFGLNGPITVHCGAGVGRTGVFIACSIALERMKFEGHLDLFQTIRALRTQRLGMVQTESQYKFCYRAALQYLRSFDMYTS